MKLRLHIHKKKKLNVYEVDLYKIEFGHAEDLLDAIDVDSMEFGSSEELENCLSLTLKEKISKIFPVITSIFGIPDEEFIYVRENELVKVITVITSYALNELSQCASNSDTKKGSSSASLYQILFDLQITLCDKFKGLNPFILRHETMQEVFLLIKRLNNTQTQENDTIQSFNGDVIRRPATDDSWF